MEKKWSAQEYETQFFSVDRVLLKKAIRDLVDEHIVLLKDEAYNDIVHSMTANDAQKEVIRSRMERIANHFKEKSAEPLRKIDEAIDEHMTIPDTVLLPMDEGCERRDNERQRLLDEIKELEARAMSAAVGVKVLERELSELRSESLRRCMKATSAVIDTMNVRYKNCSNSTSLFRAYLSLCDKTDDNAQKMDINT